MRNGVNRLDRLLVVILVVLSLSVLVTGGLAVYLTLAREGGVVEDDVAAPTATAIAPGEPRIAFVSDEEGDAAIYVMDAGGSNQQRVSGPDQGYCFSPSWSPDSQHVAYLETEHNLSEPTPFGGDEATTRVWVSAADGSERIHVSQIISNVLGVRPTWSPDGVRLAFASAAEPAEGGKPTSIIHIARIDGTIERSIPLPWMVSSIIWSPTRDEWLLIETTMTEHAESNVYVLSSEEEGEKEEITKILDKAQAADWSPEGAYKTWGSMPPLPRR